MSVKKKNHPTCEKDHTWNPSTCPCESKKYFEIGEYLEDCKCMTDFVDDLVISCDEIDNTLEIINRSNGTVYCCFSISNRVFTIAGGYDCNVLHETWITNSMLTYKLVLLTYYLCIRLRI